MKILLSYFDAKVGREIIFKSTLGKESLLQEINDNAIRLVNFAASNNLIVKRLKCSHFNIHEYTN